MDEMDKNELLEQPVMETEAAESAEEISDAAEVAETEENAEEVTEEATDKLKAVNHWAKEGSGAYAGSWTNSDVKTSRIFRAKNIFRGKSRDYRFH